MKTGNSAFDESRKLKTVTKRHEREKKAIKAVVVVSGQGNL
jgi:hypothetical protein